MGGGMGPGPRAQALGRGMGPGARFLGAEAGTPGRVVKNAPYSADIVTESVRTLPDGNHIRQSSKARFYRDSEGRTRREQSLEGVSALAPGSALPQVVFVNDPVAGTNYALNATDKTATKSPWAGNARGGPAARGRRAPGPNPQAPDPQPRPQLRRMGPRVMDNQTVKSESLGRQTIEGVPADGTRITTTIPAGEIGNEQAIQVVRERWYSPDLQTVVLLKATDPRAGETTYKLTNISRTEPAHALFEVPPDYKVTERARPAGTAR
jgi:hypothetical protein